MKKNKYNINWIYLIASLILFCGGIISLIYAVGEVFPQQKQNIMSGSIISGNTMTGTEGHGIKPLLSFDSDDDNCIIFDTTPRPSVLLVSEYDTGDMVFKTEDTNIMRLCPNGDVYIKGEKTTRDIGLYYGLKEWLRPVMGVVDGGEK